MYLAIDVGGTKTLLAVFSQQGEILASHQIATNPSYSRFIEDIQDAIKQKFHDYEFQRVCCAIPGAVDRKKGLGLHFGNLDWKNVPIQRDLSKIIGVPVLIEHDGALGGLSEAIILRGKYKKVLYITIGTGIGSGIIINDKIDPNFADSEVGHMVLEHDGELKKWEDFASGRAIKERFGKLASEIDDPQVWSVFAKDLALGIHELIAVLQPEVVVIGGGVGVYLDKFKVPLQKELDKFENKMVPTPPILKAKRAKEAVVYGCYDFIRQRH